jgi:hypothetical protein
MDKEKYNQIIDDAYFKRYRLEAWGECDRSWLLELDGINLTTGEEGKVHRQLTKEEFINKCKTDSEFAERWGLKIEERELDMMERWLMAGLTPNMTEFDYCNKLCDEHNVPTKLITITYNNETIESYEY